MTTNTARKDLTYTQLEFGLAYANAKAIEVEFDPKWKNGTGYLDEVAYAEFDNVQPGDSFIFVDDFNRRAMGICVKKGHNLVIFERYSPTAEGETSKVFVSNVHPLIKRVIDWREGAVRADLMSEVDSSYHSNVYKRLRRMAEAATELLAA